MSNTEPNTEGHWLAPRGGYTHRPEPTTRPTFWARLVARLFRR